MVAGWTRKLSALELVLLKDHKELYFCWFKCPKQLMKYSWLIFYLFAKHFNMFSNMYFKYSLPSSNINYFYMTQETWNLFVNRGFCLILLLSIRSQLVPCMCGSLWWQNVLGNQWWIYGRVVPQGSNMTPLKTTAWEAKGRGTGPKPSPSCSRQLGPDSHNNSACKNKNKKIPSAGPPLYTDFWICFCYFHVCTSVMNFQSIRNDFNLQVKEQTEALEAEQMRAHLAEELERQDRLHARTRYDQPLAVN